MKKIKKDKRIVILNCNSRIVMLILLLFGSIKNINAQEYLFRNTGLPIEQRVKDLVSRLTLEEKVLQMMENAPAIDRLGIPAYNWWNEALHGVARSGDTVTVFPQAIAMAANFDADALEKMGDMVSDEARAIYHQSLRNGVFGKQYKGLTFWTPNINIFRDPRWGRGQETYGEDPYLTGQLGKAIVRGLQGKDPTYLKTSACAKHFAVHSGPETGRHTFDVSVSKYDLWNTYLPAFRSLVVDAKVSSVMCAYNRLDGKPCCGQESLMIDILRNKWNFKGYVTSDCGAINDFWIYHKTQANANEASADAVRSGTDLECGEMWNNLWSYRNLTDAVKKGLLNEAKLNESVNRLFTIRFRLGMFNPDDQVAYASIKTDVINRSDHFEHALKMARQSMVLLKNNGVLPFSKKIKKIAVIGPNADNPAVMLGNYNGIPKQLVTPLQGIRKILGADAAIIYYQGCDYTRALADSLQPNKWINTLSGVDAIVFIGGISPSLEGEEGDAGKEKLAGFLGGDRTTINLPKVQTELMKQLKQLDKPLVFVNMSGSAMGMLWESQHTDAIIQAWYGRQSGGTAVAEVLFGDYNPSGRLPVTFYKSDSDLPEFEDYSMENRTYRYFKGVPLYSFGHGLSYATFQYASPKIPTTCKKDKITIPIKFILKNTGKTDGDEVVQLYVKNLSKKKNVANKALKHFERVSLKAGESKTIELDLKTAALAELDDNGQIVLPTGNYEIQIGASSTDIRLKSILKITK